MKTDLKKLSYLIVLIGIAVSLGVWPFDHRAVGAAAVDQPATVETQLTFDEATEYAPSFSPDGRMITYARMVMVDGRSMSKFWTMDLKGRHQRRLTATENKLDEWTPMWSPDGSNLVWCSGRTGNLDVWKVDRAGKLHTQLTSVAEADNFPIWRPDGKKIAFMSERGGESAIWVMNPDGSDLSRVSNRPTGDLGVSWSRDGKKLAYVAALNQEGLFHAGAWVINHKEPAANGAIVIQDVATGELKQITSGDHRDWYPMWSPKKDKIAFISDRSGNWDLWVMNGDGSQPAQLTFNGGLDKEPYWSPDGRSIVYVSERAGRWDVWLLDVEKTIARRHVAHAQERS